MKGQPPQPGRGGVIEGERYFLTLIHLKGM